ncbi:MAG TPA: hypothetical protein PK303_08365 [bacterium]|nr:hypothetical protein [bacterium]HOL35499.1 hypothetical protein [bacterium]HPP09117.1 hypothetical protein [bacterium]
MLKGKTLKRDSVKKSGWLNKGVALIFAIGIVLVLFVITTGLLIIFGQWEKSSFLLFSKTHSMHAAKIGIEQAIWELKNDTNNYDGYDEQWHAKFSGTDIDIDQDGIPESKFFPVQNFRKKTVARYAVLVTDESGCININYTGNISKNGKHGFNEGWTTFEIRFFPGMCDAVANDIVLFRAGQDGANGKKGIDDDNDNATVSSDGIDNDGDSIIDENDEGIDEPDEFNHVKPFGDDRPFFVIEDVKMVRGITDTLFNSIKQHITTYSYDLNIDAENYLRININKATLSQIVSIFTELGYEKDQATQIALNIIDYRDRDNIPTVIKTTDGRRFIGIEKTPYINEVEPMPELRIDKTFLKGGIPVVILEELGSNFIEIFNPYDQPVDIGGWTIKGGMVLLPSVDIGSLNTNSTDTMDEIQNGKNPSDISKITQFWSSVMPNSIKIPSGTVIKPHSYYLIGDSIKWKIVIIYTQSGPLVLPLLIPMKQPMNADQFEPILFMNFDCNELANVFSILAKIFKITLSLNGKMYLLDEQNHLIEQTDYGADKPGKQSRQKNDPRIEQWFTDNQTPGRMNITFVPMAGGEFNVANQFLYWDSSFRVKNHPFSSPAELSFIHKGSQWETLNLWKTHDKKLLDVFTVAEKPEDPVYGRININTANSLVLQCLPLVDTDIAREIVMARPFKDVSDIVGKLNDPLNKQMTKYGNNFIDDNKNRWIDTEDEKEMVISTIANLITVRANVFKIIVVSQKVLDLDNNGIITAKEIKAETRYRVIYDRTRNKILERRQL